MRRHWKILLLVIGLGVAAAVWPIVRCLTAVAPAPTGPMVQMLGTDGFTLVWQIPGGGPARVRLQGPDGRSFEKPEVHPVDGRYEVQLGGLSAATQYQYEIHVRPAAPAPDSAGSVFGRGAVRTAPQRGGSFRFLAFGDGGTGEAPQCELAKVMARYPADLIIHTGDLVYPDGATERYPEKFYRPYAELIARSAFYPCVGNHDYNDYQGRPMFEQFVLPRNGPPPAVPERHYWFDIADVRFVGFDSDETFEGLREQVVPWLDGVLADAGDRWKVVFFHHPVYTNGKYAPAGKILQLLAPLFDRHHVDLVLNGHNHMYERTRPIRGGQVVPEGEGTVYVTTGASGGELYEIKAAPPDYMAIQNNQQFSFTVIDATPQRLAVRQIAANDTVLDQFEIARPAAPPATGPAE